MTIEEFSDQFDLLYNNITSNQAPGLSEYEKSVFATKAEKEIVKNYFSPNSQGNTLKEGFDDSAKRQADFSMLLKTAKCVIPCLISCSFDGSTKTINPNDITLEDGNGNTLSWNDVDFDEDITVSISGTAYKVTIDTVEYTVTGFPFEMSGSDEGTITKIKDTTISKIDPRSSMYSYPNDVFIIINEVINVTPSRTLQVIPLRYDDYNRLMSKPFKRPLKYQAWRLMNSGEVPEDSSADKSKSTKKVEIIVHSGETISDYSLRYIKTPSPIVLANLDGDGLSIDGQQTKSTKIDIDPILHEDILQRAVELAKIAWTSTGNDNLQAELAAGQRSE